MFKTINSLYVAAATLLLTLGLGSCASKKALVQSSANTPSTNAPTAAVRYAQEVTRAHSTSKAITAKVDVTLGMGGKDLSASGTLRMLRDDVVQLSITFFGMEVGLMEFTKDEVLIVNRVQKEYMRVPYAEVGFLKQSGLDFYALQALFWNELFIPGTYPLTAKALDRFRLSESGDYAQLNLGDTPQLEYSFLTSARTHKIERTTVRAKGQTQRGTVSCTYGSFKPLGEGQFPTAIKLDFDGAGKGLSLNLALMRLDTKTDWKTRTTVSGKYTQRTAEEVMTRLGNFAL